MKPKCVMNCGLRVDRLGACLPDPWQQCGGGTAIVPTVVMGLGNE
ncbi:hypothetical protein HMPREF9622_01589 [Cutibacterium modestum HL037PA3]|nr:hypothetical protein HMPREF9621_01626 [Cutibacterium modestum HL037PA2]EFT15383.1 hypothetical protein HMPREF9622_01589 [Cutibacterium modestum HL037PA3]